MKKLIFAVVTLCISLISLAQQQSTKVALNALATEKILTNTDTKLEFVVSFDGFAMHEIATPGGLYTKLTAAGFSAGCDVGYPDLPVLTKLIELPLDAHCVVDIVSCDEQVVDLADYDQNAPIVPVQPSLRKDQDPKNAPFVANKDIYVDKVNYLTTPVTIRSRSKMRGIQVAQLVISPFSYDIADNTLTIKNNIHVSISFENGDLARTHNDKSRFYSGAFSSVYNLIWNYKAPNTKDALSRYPIKYQIVSARMFEQALQPFIAWKTKKGFTVNVAYTDEIGNSETSIKNYLKQQWNAATPTDPAPTYLLIVGDVQQVPAHNCGEHVSDMYYCEFDGGSDFVPEMYYGRFSATTPAQLTPQIEKTLMFEQYTFPDPSYLEKVTLVAGDDASFGPTHANGQVHYAADNYFNTDHHTTTTTYMYPDSRNHATDIINGLSHGVGLVNYTAHCSEDGWAGPSFTRNNIASLQNQGEYFFSIGNCCLSNKFDEPACFGESLLRASGKGAVVHIGGSNSTYWNEDFYWSVGVAAEINTNVTYENSQQGAYDHLFHEHGEDPYVTAGQMLYVGNMSVYNSSTEDSQKKYYWEIYHVMGDPSLMPYVGVPTELTVSHPTVLGRDVSTLTVETEPQAYVAVSRDGSLLAAAFTGDNNSVELNIGSDNAAAQPYDIVVTKQFKQPYIGTIAITRFDNDVSLAGIDPPQRFVHVDDATFSPGVKILNMAQNPLTSAIVSYHIDNGETQTQNWTGNLACSESAIITFPTITVANGEHTITAEVSSPNGVDDENPIDNTKVMPFSVITINPAKAEITNVVAPQQPGCGESEFIPEITIKNTGDVPITTLQCNYVCDYSSVDCQWQGNIAANATQNVKFPAAEWGSGNHHIVFSIVDINGLPNAHESTATHDFTVARDGIILHFDVKCGMRGSGLTWDIVDDNQQTIASGGPYDANQGGTQDVCLSLGCYNINVHDPEGNSLAGLFADFLAGYFKVTNTATQQDVVSLDGNSSFTDTTITVCNDGIECPQSMQLSLDDYDEVELHGYPAGGTFAGEGVVGDVFHPDIAGPGTHSITYSYNHQTCDFEITVVATPTDLTDETADDVAIYPNPTDGTIYVSSSYGIGRIEVIDGLGRVLQRKDVATTLSELDLSALTPGMYMLRVSTSAGVTVERVLVR